MTEFIKSAVRIFLNLPWMISFVIVLPLAALVAIVIGLRRGYRAIELWALYDSDQNARDRDEWRNS